MTTSAELPAFVGIDIGSSTSVMARYNPATRRAEVIKNAQGYERTPSVVYFGDKKTEVGVLAENQIEDDAQRERVVWGGKRDIASDRQLALPGRRVIAVELVAEVLRKLRQEAEELQFHRPVAKTVLTHPASFSPIECGRLEEAAHKAGFLEVKLLEEPVAAAMAYAQEVGGASSDLLVYDLGGKTFDLALVTTDSGGCRVALEPRGLPSCGGDHFDRALYEHADSQAKRLLGRGLSDDGVDLSHLRYLKGRKEELSLQDAVTINRYPGGRPLTYELKRSDFEEMIRDRVANTVRLTKGFVEEASARGYTIGTVVLIGGSSRIPLVQRMLGDVVPVSPSKWQQQDLAVALGAACHGAALWGASRQSIASKLILRTPAGQEAQFAVGCPLNRAWARQFVAADSQFWDSENQVTIQRTTEGWFARPNLAAVNETLLDGVPIVESTLLREGSRLAVGRVAKGIEKSPFIVVFDAIG